VNVTVGSDVSVTWVNNGRPFTANDAEALCRSASSSKTPGDSIGYRGIGFKSLAADASTIEVRSAEFFVRPRQSTVIHVACSR
jgi:hypothetical protein